MNAPKVLVVEDEDVVAEDIIESLTEFGFDIVGRASSYEGAIDLCEVESPDIILMDIKLEGEKDGIDVAATLSKSFPNCPVIFLTAFTDQSTLNRAKITEPYGYLVKPYKEIDLRMTIEVALQKAKAAKNHTVQNQTSNHINTDDIENINEEILQFLSQMDSFQSVSSEHLRYLAAHSILKDCPAGEFLTLEGDSGERGFVVLEGRVAMLKSSSNGRDLIVELLPPADPLGLIVCLNKMSYPYSTRAQVDSRLVWIERTVLFELLELYPELSKVFITEAFSRLRRSHEFSQLLAHEKVEIRVAATLVALLPRFSSNEHGATVVRMTRQELAELSGTTQETCIRVTRKMEKEGVLDLSENKVIGITSEKALRNIACLQEYTYERSLT